MEFLNSLKKRSKYYNTPFGHWELNEPLTKEAIKEICKTEITDLTKMNINYDGTRAIDGGEGKFRTGISHGGKAIKFRCFINKDNSKDFPSHIFHNVLFALKKYTCLVNLNFQRPWLSSVDPLLQSKVLEMYILPFEICYRPLPLELKHSSYRLATWACL